jgi:hypothetical protein
MSSTRQKDMRELFDIHLEAIAMKQTQVREQSRKIAKWKIFHF